MLSKSQSLLDAVLLALSIYPLKIFECAVLVFQSKQEFTNTKLNWDAMAIHKIK